MFADKRICANFMLLTLKILYPMKKYTLFLLCIFFATSMFSQEDSRYLEGAVPEEDGKVIFSKTITPKVSISDANLYDLMVKWADTNYKGEEDNGLLNRVLLKDASKKNIACGGETYLVFRDKLLVLDRAKMSYQLILEITSGKCEAVVRAIKYDYDSEKNISAEEMITDKVALNKKKGKLNNYYGKFRSHTVDSVNQIFESIEVYLNGEVSNKPAASQGAVATRQQEQSYESIQVEMPNYKNISSDKIPSNLINNWTLISSGKENSINVITALWGGTGSLGSNAVAFSLLNQSNGSVKVLEKEDVYVISFYTEIYQDAFEKFNSAEGSIDDKIKASGLTPIQMPSGATTFAEAWMIIECKKGTAQPAPKVSVADKNSNNKETYNQTYIGEILNVWVK